MGPWKDRIKVLRTNGNGIGPLLVHIGPPPPADDMYEYTLFISYENMRICPN